MAKQSDSALRVERAVSSTRQTSRWQSLIPLPATNSILATILVPLVVLMLLSLVGSTMGFLLNTTTSRARILSYQLDEDERRLLTVLAQQEQAILATAEIIASDEQFIAALNDHTRVERDRTVLDEQMEDVRARSVLDQVLVLDTDRQVQMSSAAPTWTPLSTTEHRWLSSCASPTLSLAVVPQGHWLIGCAPMMDGDAPVAYVYTVRDLTQALNYITEHLRLEVQATVLDDPPPVSEGGSARQQVADDVAPEYLVRETVIDLADTPVRLRLQVTGETTDRIINLGLRVILIGGIITLIMMLLVGIWLVRSLTRPLRKLSDVAEAVAAGDFSQRANLTHQDEIGQLGRSIDYATATIAQLLHEQTRAAGERQAILHSITDGVLAVDQDERIVVLNPAAATLLDQNNAQTSGQSLTVLEQASPPSLAAGVEQIITQVRRELSATDQAPTEEQITLGDRRIRLQSARTFDSRNCPTGAVVVMQDITRMYESEQAKIVFIGIASHELRTPLTSLKGFIDMLSVGRTDNFSEQQRMCITQIQTQAGDVINLVNALLEVTRLEQSEQRLERRWTNVESAIDAAVQELERLIQKRRVTVQVDVPPDLPPVWVDALHLRRILNHIISNAVKYVYRGGKVQVYAQTLDDPSQLPSQPLPDMPWRHQRQESLLIVVEDNGVGIRREDQPALFTRFFRSENPLSKEVGGNGLGLAITRTLVSFQQGQIGFWSVEGQGSCFWVRLPVPDTAPLLDKPSPVAETT